MVKEDFPKKDFDKNLLAVAKANPASILNVTVDNDVALLDHCGSVINVDNYIAENFTFENDSVRDNAIEGLQMLVADVMLKSTNKTYLLDQKDSKDNQYLYVLRTDDEIDAQKIIKSMVIGLNLGEYYQPYEPNFFKKMLGKDTIPSEIVSHVVNADELNCTTSLSKHLLKQKQMSKIGDRVGVSNVLIATMELSDEIAINHPNVRVIDIDDIKGDIGRFDWSILVDSVKNRMSKKENFFSDTDLWNFQKQLRLKNTVDAIYPILAEIISLYEKGHIDDDKHPRCNPKYILGALELDSSEAPSKKLSKALKKAKMKPNSGNFFKVSKSFFNRSLEEYLTELEMKES